MINSDNLNRHMGIISGCRWNVWSTGTWLGEGQGGAYAPGRQLQGGATFLEIFNIFRILMPKQLNSTEIEGFQH